MRHILFLILLTVAHVSMAQSPTFTIQQNMAGRRYFADSTAKMPALNTNRTFATNRDSIGQFWMRLDSAKMFIRRPGNIINAVAIEDTTRALRWAIASGSGLYIQNQSAADQNASWRISGQARILGSTSYKMFMERANSTSQLAVIGFKTGVDTIGYVGLPSLNSNEISLNSIKGRVSIRTPRDSAIVLGQLNTEIAYVSLRRGKMAIGDTVSVNANYPVEIQSYQDTSLNARRRVLAGGIMTNAGFWGNIRIASVTGNVSVDDFTVLGNTSGGNITLTLPPAASSMGKILHFKKTSSTNTMTIQGNGAEQIDNANTYVISTFLASVTIHCNGVTWYIL